MQVHEVDGTFQIYRLHHGGLSLMHAVDTAERLSQAGSGTSSSKDFWEKTRGTIASCR